MIHALIAVWLPLPFWKCAAWEQVCHRHCWRICLLQGCFRPCTHTLAINSFG